MNQQEAYPPPQVQQPGYGPGMQPQQVSYDQQQLAYPPPQPGYPSPAQPVFNSQPGYPPEHPQVGFAPQPVQQQPGAQQGVGGWMTIPAGVPSNCPPGLEYLTQIDQLLIKQQVELLEAFTGFEMNNKYKVLNSLGQQVYFAIEDTDCCTRNCCGPSRPFDIRIVDNLQREIIHLTRPLRCSSCWIPCCLQELEVQSPPGTAIGYVKQLWSICIPRYAITTATHETVLQIEGPFCQCNICGDVEFKVLAADGLSEVGMISKQWSGLAKEAFTDADNFGVSFPMDLDVKVKATMLGAVFLIDFMFFEQSQNRNNHHHH